MLTLGGALGLAAAGLIEQWGGQAPSTVVFAGMGPSWRPARAHR